MMSRNTRSTFTRETVPAPTESSERFHSKRERFGKRNNYRVRPNSKSYAQSDHQTEDSSNYSRPNYNSRRRGGQNRKRPNADPKQETIAMKRDLVLEGKTLKETPFLTALSETDSSKIARSSRGLPFPLLLRDLGSPSDQMELMTEVEDAYVDKLTKFEDERTVACENFDQLNWLPALFPRKVIRIVGAIDIGLDNEIPVRIGGSILLYSAGLYAESGNKKQFQNILSSCAASRILIVCMNPFQDIPIAVKTLTVDIGFSSKAHAQLIERGYSFIRNGVGSLFAKFKNDMFQVFSEIDSINFILSSVSYLQVHDTLFPHIPAAYSTVDVLPQVRKLLSVEKVQKAVKQNTHSVPDTTSDVQSRFRFLDEERRGKKSLFEKTYARVTDKNTSRVIRQSTSDKKSIEVTSDKEVTNQPVVVPRFPSVFQEAVEDNELNVEKSRKIDKERKPLQRIEKMFKTKEKVSFDKREYKHPSPSTSTDLRRETTKNPLANKEENQEYKEYNNDPVSTDLTFDQSVILFPIGIDTQTNVTLEDNDDQFYDPTLEPKMVSNTDEKKSDL